MERFVNVLTESYSYKNTCNLNVFPTLMPLLKSIASLSFSAAHKKRRSITNTFCTLINIISKEDQFKIIFCRINLSWLCKCEKSNVLITSVFSSTNFYLRIYFILLSFLLNYFALLFITLLQIVLQDGNAFFCMAGC